MGALAPCAHYATGRNFDLRLSVTLPRSQPDTGQVRKSQLEYATPTPYTYAYINSSIHIHSQLAKLSYSCIFLIPSIMSYHAISQTFIR